MFKILVTYKFGNKENRDAFYEIICDNNISAETLKQDGCLKYDFEIPQSETELLLHEEWENRDKQQAHLKEPTVSLVKEYKTQFDAETELTEL